MTFEELLAETQRCLDEKCRAARIPYAKAMRSRWGQPNVVICEVRLGLLECFGFALDFGEFRESGLAAVAGVVDRRWLGGIDVAWKALGKLKFNGKVGDERGG